MSGRLLEVRELGVRFAERQAVFDVSFDVGAGEVVALVGESGSGKTLTARALLGLLPYGATVLGRAMFRGEDLLKLDDPALRAVRGAQIGMVFQEPMSSLNPSMRVGEQLAEGLRLHEGLSAEAARARCAEMLRRVGIAEPEAALDRYPHHFSGGMRQRLMLASVMLLRPRLLIADEPTTALDVIVQKDVLELMTELAKEAGSGVLLITHDLGVVAEHADRTVVMRHGRVVEAGSTQELLRLPKTQYARDLLAALPQRSASPPPREAEPLVEVRDLRVHYRGRRPTPWSPAPVIRSVDGVSLSVPRGQTLAVVGESGSGKTSLARALLRLVEPAGGHISFAGLDVRRLRGRALQDYRRRVRIVFQDPFSALDPRMRVLQVVEEGLRGQPGLDGGERRRRSLAMLEAVGLPGDFAARFPHQLSGGQRQRVNIARALVAGPELVIADEPVSALDLTVQAEILRLLSRLQEELGFSCLFISHALGVVEQIAHRVAVIYRGRLVEAGSRDDIFDRPQHPYTRALLRAAPRLVGGAQAGYRLAPYPAAQARADDDPARWQAAQQLAEIAPGHVVAAPGFDRMETRTA